MSARFTAVALITATAWCAWQWHVAALSIGGATLRVLACAFIAAGVGKLVGILLFRARGGQSLRSGSARSPHRTAPTGFR